MLCKPRSFWKTTGHSVVSNNDDCTSTLRYSVNLKQPGNVTFSYQYSDVNVIFHFFVCIILLCKAIN